MGRVMNFIRLKGNWLLLFMLIIVKYAYYGYSYLPVRDDNNAYGVFRLYDNYFQDVILHYKTYTVRPVVALLDPYFWTSFWDNLGAALFIITCMHFVSCILIYKILKAYNLNFGMGAAVLFALMPMGIEATYWISASTRIVVGLLFVLFSLYLLTVYFAKEYKGGKQSYYLLGAFAITHLLSMGFYEQLIALSFCATALLFVVNWKRLKQKWIVILPAVNFGFIVFWYKFFSGQGMAASRGMLIGGNYIEHAKKVVKSIYQIWETTIREFLGKSVTQGLRIIAQDGNYLFFALIVILSIGVFYYSFKEKNSGNSRVKIIKIFLGLGLFAIPLIPFFILESVVMFKRNIFLSFIGLGLIFDAMLSFMSGRLLLNVLRSLFIAVVSFVFLTANVYELNYYRQLGQVDREITGKISEIKESSEYLKGEKNLILFNAKAVYIDSYKGRSQNCTNADWALTGALEAHNSLAKLKLAYPVFDKYKLPLSRDIIESAVLLGIDDRRSVFPLRITGKKGNTVVLSLDNGMEFGRVEILPENRIMFSLTDR